MANFISTGNHSLAMSFALRQFRSGQDYISNGTGNDVESGESFQWVMLNDGHGTDSCINFIRNIPTDKKSELIGQPEPVTAIAKFIDDSKCVSIDETRNIDESSGATLVILKCYNDRAVLITSGDSQGMVFKNGELVHITKEHNGLNDSEVKRLSDLGVRFAPSKNIKVVSETVLTEVPALYAVFKYNNHLATTQALGHNSKTGYAPDVTIIPFEENSVYKFVLGSDGLFDMMMLDNDSDIQKLKTKTCQDICDWAVSRWLQVWSPHVEDSPDKFSYSSEHCDDVSVAVIDVSPKI
jgi:serine/threonine protein phosphatase PrpC